jgi:chromosome segregation ATPase
LSVSNRSRGPRAGGKGAATKRTKRAKSEFQGHKKHSAPPKEEDREAVRKRTLESLEHLGHQKLPNEPGGYDLRGWLKSLKTLLNDFEAKIGADSLPDEFRAKRKEIEAEFSKPANAAQIEAEIESVRKEEGDIRAKLKEESERIAARLSAIGGEKTGKNLELERERANLRKVEEERRSVSIFSRLVGKSGPSAEPVRKRVEDLESGLKMLEEEAVNLQAVRKSIEGVKSATSGIYEDLWVRIEILQKKLAELDVAREARMQLAHEREAAAEALRKFIAELNLKKDSEEA